jgi:hypothetical protein
MLPQLCHILAGVTALAEVVGSLCNALHAVLGPAKPPQAGPPMRSRMFVPRRSRLALQSLACSVGASLPQLCHTWLGAHSLAHLQPTYSYTNDGSTIVWLLWSVNIPPTLDTP